MVKKKVILKKFQNLWSEKDIILLYQYNNVSIKNWHSLKNELSKISDIKSLVVQNKIGNIGLNFKKKNLLSKNNCISTFTFQEFQSYTGSNMEHTSGKKKYNIEQLFQGPTFIIGCTTIKEVASIADILKNYSNFVFLGGFFENQSITHLDLHLIVKLNEKVYIDLITILEDRKYFIYILKQYLQKMLCTLPERNFVALLNIFVILKKLKAAEKV